MNVAQKGHHDTPNWYNRCHLIKDSEKSVWQKAWKTHDPYAITFRIILEKDEVLNSSKNRCFSCFNCFVKFYLYIFITCTCMFCVLDIQIMWPYNPLLILPVSDSNILSTKYFSWNLFSLKFEGHWTEIIACIHNCLLQIEILLCITVKTLIIMQRQTFNLWSSWDLRIRESNYQLIDIKCWHVHYGEITVIDCFFFKIHVFDKKN